VLRSKHLVGLILAATLMATLVPSLTAVYAKGQDKQQEKAEAFVAAAVDAMNEVDVLMSTIEEVPSEVDTLYGWGEGNLTAAQAELGKEEPDYASAISLAREAMSIFREVYRQLHTLLDDAGVAGGDIESSDEAQGLNMTIDRAFERIARIENVVDLIPTTPPPEDIERLIDWVRGNLSDAEDYLTDARTALTSETPNIEWAVGNLTLARGHIHEAFANLRQIAGWTSYWRIESFLMGIRKSYERALELLKKRGVEPNAIIKGYIEGNITDAREHMINAMEYWNAGEKESAKTERKYAIEDLRNARDQLRLLRKGGPEG